MPLLKGLELSIKQPQKVLKEILAWTQGQPFLTQKLCDLTVQFRDGEAIVPGGMEAPWVENLVRTYIIQNWEAQDEPEHLRTIRDRLEQNPQLIGRILGIYQKILQGKLPQM